ncbi:MULTISPECIES: hypothetical protein [unclassified Brenneria]|uniref:hypothetical protein n=1 Tax=unclassified Brenneria TaxID=2634434 RepID=UPI00155673B7|nr:hypothetical protein [Brenneria sp. hezel4-2-4]MEE3650369.1 hypothetical protein [Brenneria sp. HEZEL_4_2_4]NPD00325.1 hypothetical protein [Brenneria sp. hezel4-2-4]
MNRPARYTPLYQGPPALVVRLRAECAVAPSGQILSIGPTSAALRFDASRERNGVANRCDAASAKALS